MAGAASQAGDADSSRAAGLTSGLQGSVNVNRCALLLVPQLQCISSFVFYIGSRKLPISEILGAKTEIEPRTSCSASKELIPNYYTTAAPKIKQKIFKALN